MTENIRNFVIIAHIDAGKSTLADRFLELTKTVDKRKMQPQYLDLMDLEREKGITIKMQPVRMDYDSALRAGSLNSQIYTFNLIDTPGHIDFSYEVSRSLAAVEGAILLVDAARGIQAQTIGNLELAKKQGLVIIPVINKIDLAIANVEESAKELVNLLGIQEKEIIKISAKEGTHVEDVLKAVLEKIPCPKGSKELPLRALIFDSKYDPHKGVIAFVRIFDGQIKSGEKIYLIQSKNKGETKEVGVFKPEFSKTNELGAGEIGYIATGIKEPEKIRVGDTIVKISNHPIQTLNIEPLSGYEEPRPKVFLSIYPKNSDDFEDLKIALEKLKLTDASLFFKAEFKEGLGRGFQCGFLGLLHGEIITERLKREFDLDLVLSLPSVLYKVFSQNQKEKYIFTSTDWPDPSQILSSQELWAKTKIITPLNYFGSISKLLGDSEAKYIKTEYLGQEKAELIYEIPLREIVVKNLYDKIKSASKGFASMDYEILEWREVKLVKLDILILGRKEESLSKIVPELEAEGEGRRMVKRLKEVLPPRLFALSLQAAIGSKIIARETIGAQRRDVIAPLYGGDYSRKRKLLEKQKKGKKALKEKARVTVPPDVFFEILKK